jgi:hypothetical protein
MKTTVTTALSTNSVFANAQQFASWISNRLGRSQVIKLNKRSGSDRIDMLMHEIVMYSKGDEIAFEYDNAAYGLQWAINTGRCNAETVLAVRAMNTRQLSMLVHELMAKCNNIGEYARYLMQKQLNGKLKSIKKATKATKSEVKSEIKPVEPKFEPKTAPVTIAKVATPAIAVAKSNKYNATVYEKRDGKIIAAFTAYVNENGKMLRSNSVQFSGYEGSEAYDEMLRSRFNDREFYIVLDGCQGYKNALGKLMLPEPYYA